MNKNSFSSSSVWNFEYGLRFLRTVTTWFGHSKGFDGVADPMPEDPVMVDPIKDNSNGKFERRVLSFVNQVINVSSSGWTTF